MEGAQERRVAYRSQRTFFNRFIFLYSSVLCLMAILDSLFLVLIYLVYDLGFIAYRFVCVLKVVLYCVLSYVYLIEFSVYSY